MEIEDLEKILLKKPEMKLSQLEKERIERHYRENVKKTRNEIIAAGKGAH